MNKILEIRNLSKSYGRKGYKTMVLQDISMDIYEGDFIAIMGPSGSGKTTLLNLLSTLDKPDRGEILLEGDNVIKMKNKKLSLIRRDKIGFIFQDYNLLDNMTLQDNIALPLTLNGVSPEKTIQKVQEKAVRFGLEAHLKKYPYQLSGRTETKGCQCPGADHKPQDPLCG